MEKTIETKTKIYEEKMESIKTDLQASIKNL
jgi:hypothetical protein